MGQLQTNSEQHLKQHLFTMNKNCYYDKQ